MKQIIYIFLFGILIAGCAAKEQEADDVAPVKKIVPGKEPVITPIKFTAENLAGTWTITEHITHEQLKSLLGDGVGDAERAEMNLTGKQAFTPGGDYISNGKMSLTIRNNQSYSEVPLNFNYTENGTWRISGDTLSGTITGGTYTAADEPTRELMQASPQLAEALNPVKGETTKLLVVSIKPGELVLKDIQSGWQSVLRR